MSHDETPAQRADAAEREALRRRGRRVERSAHERSDGPARGRGTSTTQSLASYDERPDLGDEPDPDDPRKPDDPTDITTSSWKYAFKGALRQFSRDQCTDNAAGLVYYGVLAMFPAAIALLSLVGLVGDGAQSAKAVLDVLRQVGAGSIADTLQPTLIGLARQPGAGFGFVVGLLAALWSASGYVGSFGRAMNRILEVEEGRPVWKLRPVQLLLTLVVVVLVALLALALTLTGSVAQAVGDKIGLGSTAVLVWDIAKWPVMLFVVVLIVALLYYVTPNVQQPKFRWISVGAVTAIVIWLVASAAFGFYVANFASYDKTYGSLAGAVVFLLWLWLTNLALLFGAEVDSELERARELQAGLVAEEQLQLPPRDDRGIEKAERKREEAVAQGRALREEHADR